MVDGDTRSANLVSSFKALFAILELTFNHGPCTEMILYALPVLSCPMHEVSSCQHSKVA